jgi:hypothetical protein
MHAHILLPQHKISLRHLAGNNSIIPYSPNLAPNDFHVFLHLKTFLARQRFHDEVKEAVGTRGLHRKQRHSMMQGYKNQCQLKLPQQ